ncbi:MAG: PEP-CTERM sorting domain-containing protein [Terrimicrobiaceae bacterium]|nr:PEP-CTERM sorting domain-containing protein [Terrimicrobiaceae bacterium]
MGTGVSNAALVFDASFNTDTNPGNNIVATGGTGVVGSITNGTDAVSFANPLSSLSGGYLNAVQSPTSPASGFAIATFTPSTPGAGSSATGLGTFYAGQVNGFTALQGGMDVFVRPDTLNTVQHSGWFRLLDSNNLGSVANAGGLRFIITGTNGVYNASTAPLGNIQIQIAASANTAGGPNVFSNLAAVTGPGAAGTNGTNSVAATNNLFITTSQAANGFGFAEGISLHIGFTFETDLNGLITMRLFGVTGTGAIDTSASSPQLLVTQTFNLAGSVGLSASSVFQTGAWNIRQNTALAGDTVSVSYDELRLYNSAPASFDALPVPEPGTYALGMAGLLALVVLRRRRRAAQGF